MSLARKIKTIGRMAKDPYGLALYVSHKFSEQRYEKYFGIATGEEITLESLGINDPDAVHYSPAPYVEFMQAMRLVRAPFEKSTFVDYGSGLGRIIACAATMPFKRVVGVELSEKLNQLARENLRKADSRFKCLDVSVCTANAMIWKVPSDTTVFHLYNPFLGEKLLAVLRNIVASLEQHPREAWIVFGSPWQMADLMRRAVVIPHAWQKGFRDVKWMRCRKLGGFEPDGFRTRVYRLDSREGRSATDRESSGDDQDV